MTATDQPPEVFRYEYALDEITGLRAGAAYGAGLIEQVTCYASLPDWMRAHLEGVCARLREAARGAYDDAWYRVDGADLKAALRAAGAPETLTRATWEDERV